MEFGDFQQSNAGNGGMEKLIPIINGLQDACAQTGLTLQLDLPQIAVVGCQSAGKSSVLENFVGRDFLPRGNGIVTRRPLILQLTNAETEYGQFLHRLDTLYEDFNEIRKQIRTETDRITGTNKGISEDPINLRIFSPNVLDVTLVDLPGLTKVPIGDQPPDIEQQIRDMILNYIGKPNCLILAVTPANTDLANSDALKLAREVDPDGNRTIGVITKLDLMDAGTDARDVLENQVFPLQRGYVGVVNRSQKDIKGNKNIQTALKAEASFFVNHPSYNHMAERCGTAYLQQVLNRELTEHIRKSMPTLQAELQKKMTHFDHEVQKYKGNHLGDPKEMKQMMLKVSQKISSDFKNAIGAFGQESVETDELSAGAKINIIFHKRLPEEIEKIQLDEDGILREIDITIRNIHGIRVGLFSPQMAFEKFAEKQISKLKQPIKTCINLVIEELSAAVRTCTQKIIYPQFQEYLKKYINKYISETEQTVLENVLYLVEIEMAYMNTYNLDFYNKNDAPDDESDDESSNNKPLLVSVSTVGSSTSQKTDNKNNEKSELELHQEVIDMFNKLMLYIEHVKANLNDMVPKAITYSIIKKLVDFISHEVVYHSMALSSDEHPKLFQLDGMEKVKYLAATKMLAACKEALEAIHDLSEQTNAIGIKRNKAQ